MYCKCLSIASLLLWLMPCLDYRIDYRMLDTSVVNIQTLIHIKPCVWGRISTDAADCAHNPKKAQCFFRIVLEPTFLGLM